MWRRVWGTKKLRRSARPTSIPSWFACAGDFRLSFSISSAPKVSARSCRRTCSKDTPTSTPWVQRTSGGVGTISSRTQWRHGDSVTFAANPFYWRGKPRIDRLVYRIIPDPNTRLEQLRTGEVDAYFDVDPTLLPEARSIQATRLALTPVNDVHVLRFNLRDPTLRDLPVRQAIAMAIDRRTLVAAATHGSGMHYRCRPAEQWLGLRRSNSRPSLRSRRRETAAGRPVARSDTRDRSADHQRLVAGRCHSPRRSAADRRSHNHQAISKQHVLRPGGAGGHLGRRTLSIGLRRVVGPRQRSRRFVAIRVQSDAARRSELFVLV